MGCFQCSSLSTLILFDFTSRRATDFLADQTDGLSIEQTYNPSVLSVASLCMRFLDTPQPEGVRIFASTVLPRYPNASIQIPLFGYVHKRTQTVRPRLKRFIQFLAMTSTYTKFRICCYQGSGSEVDR
jgi:hypothetical protein